MKLLSKVSVLGVLISTFSLSGCQKPEQHTEKATSTTENTAVKTLSIGFQKSSLSLLVAKQQKLFEQEFPNAKIEWREFPAGPQMLEALAVGAVDFGYVGNTPPIFAQAASKPLSYVAYEVVAPTGQAVLVHANDKISTLQDLKGKRIAVQKGSSAHELLAKTLQKAGLSWQDIQPIWLPPADARAAFDKQAVDAWAIWEPYLGTAELQGHTKTLVDGSAFPTTYSFYIGNPDYIKKHPDSAPKLIKSINLADQWIVQHQDQALQIYAQSTGLSLPVAQRVLDKRPKPSPVHILTPEVVQSQQQIADLFKQEQLIPVQIDIQHSVWSAQ
ncbi:aliphatic sulfonate ABC transporter substrate-binding protein [Acinetobacter vivianii]|uniref:aliphatic sulfonate ABC transporter substrate-binding protein n=1 Tax=Acinetobacter vivianii TaxID=1776742 RepID=UPI002DC00D43|nr:aliphatic sulfonate ABC transporter substrate-binding protein [Acinetobacter vivianii]MEB6481046.1 aliphatic sulfonate ABC transporter substrate-binding protein [Acinetobacter vivianii]MEB6659330.1 aliphatic sulfonate ABC transporter substrate-binding protein [Acinetobacter vivianii]